MNNQIQEAREIAERGGWYSDEEHKLVCKALLQITEGDVVIVPREPTVKMLLATGARIGSLFWDDQKKNYKAMISQQEKK